MFVGLTSSDCLIGPDILPFSHTWMEIGECKGFVTVNTFTKSKTLERWGLKRPDQAYLPLPNNVFSHKRLIERQGTIRI